MAAAHDPSVDPASADGRHLPSQPDPPDQAGLPDLRRGGAGRQRHEVERSVDIDGDLDDVWSLLTEQDGLSTWLGAEVDLEVRPGAAGRVIDPDGARREVLVTDVEPHRIAWHWWQDDGPLSSVEIVAVPTSAGTRVTVVERLETPVPAGPGPSDVLSASALRPSARAVRARATGATRRAGASGSTGASGSLRLAGDPLTGTIAAAWTLRLTRLRVAAARPHHAALVG